MKMLQTLTMEQKEELAKLHIEHPAAVKVRNAAVEQMMKARVEKSRVVDRMKKMAEETRKEMEVVEAMKKQLRLRGELDHLGDNLPSSFAPVFHLLLRVFHRTCHVLCEA